ncbi:sirohydrochlorin ferrochelatase [Mycobacterium frederiksbergense]|uniref:Sirohydrochlorin ferrochelatase n=1 Tax=Mycolicibacterium frederiksbergense TaxID=117567 RepID=A0ABT6KZ45_9MYCO|nr:sirohydrochlorin chelatase [Mycolicibacterium frederiksbergense]MDH6195972.1 sirohydrochlorin ferrochelatase [Mycolicibacterium frederiksbergense]
MSLVLAAHGTRKPGGVAMINDLAGRVSDMLGRQVHVSFVDVVGPTPSEVLASLPTDCPAVVVPAFLAAGYHVRVDVPAHVTASAHPAVTVTNPLGPCPGTVRVLADRLVESGWRPGDSVILAAAGTTDRGAQSDLRRTAALLSALTGDRVELAFAATGAPTVAEAVGAQRGRSRVAVASYLLADGLFQDRLRESGADLVGEPLGTHPGLVRLIANRFRRAGVLSLPAAA